MRQKVLLIGANGLVGKSFRSLYEEVFQITAIGSHNEHEIENHLQESFDVVIFCAQSKDYKERTFTADLLKVNVSLLHRTLLASVGKCERFIYFSTGSVYNFSQSGGVINEQTVLNVNSGNPYVASKLMGEELVHAFSGKFGASLILRPFFIYGRNQKDTMLFSAMKQKITNGEKIELAAGKGLVFNPIYVSDVSLFLKEWITETGVPSLETVNLFGQTSSSLAEVVDIMSQQLNKTALIAVTDGAAGQMVASTVTGRDFGHTTVLEGIRNFLNG